MPDTEDTVIYPQIAQWKEHAREKAWAEFRDMFNAKIASGEWTIDSVDAALRTICRRVLADG